MKPDVNIIETNGNLGRVAPAEDGTSLLLASGAAVSGQFALGDVMGPFTSLADAEAKGLTAAYDTANRSFAHQHISDFFAMLDLMGAKGTELYVQINANSVTMTDMCDKTLTYAKTALSQGNRKIKLVGVTRVPDAAYITGITYTGQFDTDVSNAIPKAKALVIEEFGLHRPVSFIIEGRDFQGNASSTTNLRDLAGPNANRVSIMMGNDNDIAAAQSIVAKSKYASVGLMLGKAAAIAVQRNIGRVKDGDLLITNAGYSNGAAVDTLTETNTDSLHDHGYVFFRRHTGKAGFFFNDDNCACPITDDYSGLAAGRTMDKVARIARQVFLEDLLDNIDLDPATGRLDVATCKYYQGEVEKEVNAQMTNNGEIVRVVAYVDPNQNVTITDKLSIQINIRRKGTARDIEAKLAFEATT